MTSEALTLAERLKDEASRLQQRVFRDRCMSPDCGIASNLAEEAANGIEARDARIAELERERDALKLQAQSWAMEAKGHKSTVHEAYQACTGATGEPGNWHGADPIKDALATAIARAEASERRLAVQSAPAGWVEILDEDTLTDILADSLDMDWHPRDGAKAILRYLERTRHERS